MTRQRKPIRRRKPLPRNTRPLKRTPLARSQKPIRRSPVRRKRKHREPIRIAEILQVGGQPAVRVYPDGREVCLDTPAGDAEYKRRTEAMWERQNGACGLRPHPIPRAQATFEHVDGRGSGGAKRDDRIEKDGRPYNLAACWFCNSEKGSMSMAAWQARLEAQARRTA